MHRPDFENEYSCVFPTLNTDFHGGDSRGCATVQLSSCKEALEAFCGIECDGDKVKLFHLAWAIVLRAYTRVDKPVFALLKGTSGGDDNDASCGDRAVLVDLVKHEEIKHLLQDVDGKGFDLGRLNQRSINTGFIYDNAVNPELALPVRNTCPGKG